MVNDPVKPVQRIKALFPIEVTDDGMVKGPVKPEQAVKA